MSHSTTDINRDNFIKRVFSDSKNYPYGFSRSGDFSINESRALSQFGALIAALVDGIITPTTDQDNNYLAVAHGLKKPQSVAEKAWMKYQSRINRPKAKSIYGTSNVQVEDVEVDVLDDNSDLDI